MTYEGEGDAGMVSANPSVRSYLIKFTQLSQQRALSFILSKAKAFFLPQSSISRSGRLPDKPVVPEEKR